MEKRRHGDLPAAADLAEQVVAGHLDVVEEDLVELGVAGDLPQRAHLDAVSVHVDDHVGEALVPLGVGVRAADQDAEVGDVRVRRPDLLAVDDEAAVSRLDAGPHRGEVRARSRLREALAPDLLGAQDLLQVALLLLLGAVRHDRRAGHSQADHADVLGRLRSRELLEHDRLVAVRGALAAVLLGPGEADEAGVVQLPAPLAPWLGGQVRLEPLAHLCAEGRFVR